MTSSDAGQGGNWQPPEWEPREWTSGGPEPQADPTGSSEWDSFAPASASEPGEPQNQQSENPDDIQPPGNPPTEDLPAPGNDPYTPAPSSQPSAPASVDPASSASASPFATGEGLGEQPAPLSAASAGQPDADGSYFTAEPARAAQDDYAPYDDADSNTGANTSSDAESLPGPYGEVDPYGQSSATPQPSASDPYGQPSAAPYSQPSAAPSDPYAQAPVSDPYAQPGQAPGQGSPGQGAPTSDFPSYQPPQGAPTTQPYGGYGANPYAASNLPATGYGAATYPTGGQVTNGKAVPGFVLSVVGLFCCAPAAIVGLILSILANKEIKEQPHRFSGGGLAMAGIVLGSLGLVISAISYIVQIAGS